MCYLILAYTVKLASLYGVVLSPYFNFNFNENRCHIRNLHPQISHKRYSNHLIAPILRDGAATLLSK